MQPVIFCLECEVILYMRLLVDDKDLQLLLEKKRDLIGNKVTIDMIIAGVSFMLSVITADYGVMLGVSGVIWKTIFFMIGVYYCAKRIYQMRKNEYTHETLYNDIKKLDEIQHNHSLVIIKNTFGEDIDNYLVYFDERWECKLFLNYKTQVYNDEQNIINNVSSDLRINPELIHCNYIASKIQEKYSYSHKENRIYNHRLYEVRIDQFDNEMKKNDFKKDKKHYYWMTMDQMQNDSEIQKKNLDVIDFVKEVGK